jgi:GH15 family glucan-1,4-alpha-glucosidase
MTSIAGYALLGDCHSAALVALDGSIDWWCPARFDAPSVFARLLDPEAGHWSIRPRDQHTVTRRYVEGTMVVQTEFATDSGVLRLTDALALGAGERGHQIGSASPHLLVRRVEAVGGEVEVELVLAARPEYGLVTPQLTATALGIEIAGGADRLTLAGDRPLNVEQGRAVARFSLAEGDSAVFTLHHRRSADPVSAPLDGRAALEDTIAGWRSWTAMHHGYQGPYREQVQRSGLVLQALTYQPTGAVVAAATTSLPEEIGGSANWDYRFGWVRDGSFTLKALWVAACPDEGQRFFDWIAASTGPVGDGQVPIMFGVGGEHDLTEHELGHLSGYAGSRPVRVGNDAWTQTQLDVLGEVLECAWVLRDQLDGLSPAAMAFLRALADRAAATWREPDAGIWEGREGERDYLTSKVMCWVERQGSGVHRRIRLRPPRRRGPAPAHRGVPARRRRTGPRHPGRHREGVVHERFGAALDRLGRRGRVRHLLLLAGHRTGDGRPGRAREGDLRDRQRLLQRRRTAVGGDRPSRRRADRELPPGAVPHRSGQRRLGHRPGRGPRP